MFINAVASVIIIRQLQKENGAMVAVLEEIADEQKVYLGHGDYDIIPLITAEEAQDRERDVVFKYDLWSRKRGY